MIKVYNLARMTTATTGTGTITLGSAVAGYLSFANAGVSDGESVYYGIKDGNNSEVGYGVYTSSGTTLTRNVIKSTNSNNAISLSGSAEVYITALAETFSQSYVSITKKYIDDLSSLANSSRTNFPTTKTVVSGTLDLYVNGLLQRQGTHYTMSGVSGFDTTFTPASGDVLIADYFYNDGTLQGTYLIDTSASGGGTTYATLSGLVNSSNTQYAVSAGSYVTGTLRVFLNGQLQTQGSTRDYVETTPASGIFTFNTAPTTGDIITVEYGGALPASVYRSGVTTNGHLAVFDGSNTEKIKDGGTPFNFLVGQVFS